MAAGLKNMFDPPKTVPKDDPSSSAIRFTAAKGAIGVMKEFEELLKLNPEAYSQIDIDMIRGSLFNDLTASLVKKN